MTRVKCPCPRCGNRYTAGRPLKEHLRACKRVSMQPRNVKHLYNVIQHPARCPLCHRITSKDKHGNTRAAKKFIHQMFPPKLRHEVGRVRGVDVITRIMYVARWECDACGGRFDEAFEFRRTAGGEKTQ